MKYNKVLVAILAVAAASYGIYSYMGADSSAPTTQPTAAAPAQEGSNADPKKSKWVAEFNGQKIYQDEVEDKLKRLFGGKLPNDVKDFSALPDEMQQSILKNMVIQRLIGEEARKTDIEHRSTVQQEIIDAKSDIVQREFINDMVKAATTEKRMKKEYDALAAKLSKQKEFKISHIVTASKKDSEDAMVELKNGEKFSEIAAKRSIDGTKNSGGEIGYVSEGEMPKELEDAVKKLKVGEMSKPVESKFGWHIIKLEESRPIKVPSFEEAKPTLEKKIGQEVVQAYINDLVNKAKISYNIVS